MKEMNNMTGKRRKRKYNNQKGKYFSEGDYVDFRYWHNAGVNEDVYSSQQYTYVTITKDN